MWVLQPHGPQCHSHRIQLILEPFAVVANAEHVLFDRHTEYLRDIPKLNTFKNHTFELSPPTLTKSSHTTLL